MNALFHIPGLSGHFLMNYRYIELFRKNPALFNDNTDIASVYGTFPPALWNGGRSVRGSIPLDQCKTAIDAFNSLGVKVRLTFTNPLLEEKHLSDPFCNALCKLAENDMNEIIIFSPLLEEYLRKNYPKFTYTSSTCKQIEDADELRAELEKDYRLVVLDYNWNNRFDFLKTLPAKEKCEFLLNAICISHCPKRKYHYQYLGRQQILNNEIAPIIGIPGATIVDSGMKPFKCPFNTSLENGMNEKTYISRESVYKDYIPMGFNNFKLEGRTYTHKAMLEEYIKYMVKPECADEVRAYMKPFVPEDGVNVRNTAE